jgi:hypothetical protein
MASLLPRNFEKRDVCYLSLCAAQNQSRQVRHVALTRFGQRNVIFSAGCDGHSSVRRANSALDE